MNKMEKVSIIVAIYKSAPFLPKLIESIIAQTYKHLEVILVDDGSPDSSGTICDEYAKKDDRIFVIHKQNEGACKARNDGLKKSTGDYVVIVDGDDWLEVDFVAYLLNLIHKYDVDMALSDKLFTTRDREQTQEDCFELWTPEEATCKIIYPHMEIGPWNKIYKRELLENNNVDFSIPWSGEGLYFASKAAQYSKGVAVGHRKIYNYRLNNVNSGLTNYNVQMGINALENIKYIGKTLHIDTPRTRAAVKWHIWKNYNFLLFLIIATNKQKELKELYKECLIKTRTLLYSGVIMSDLPLKRKLGMIYIGLFCVYNAKRVLKIKNEALTADKMK